ncbi:hypothetical protein QE429_001384 [Bacillus sp. SORGH_AS 510]|nr:hypothetical protein [Bacillus sp. SORGH_AS_0510]MDQ1144557.1 hypothetical protein [Bacillus sp. SORGH_AS_0510]
MKKYIVLLFSVSMLILFTSNADIKSEKLSNNVAYSTPCDHPIQPPVG